jgi:long-chain acyl-CoA synthetase
VAEAVVTSAPNDVLGEIPVALVELREGCQTAPDALIEHCRKYLSPFKVPRTIRIVDVLPRTHSGKVARACVASSQ